ncbi:MAG: UDP-N-acetylglucosamine--N-acetylmuramyl-(pentapeptide) pyrophosphoryl-undecaprenol N-acetylglucosamine transferase [Collinsella sp.]
MTDKMTVAIAAGGTAGHINPALALAEELRDRGHHVVFVGQSRKLEGRLVPRPDSILRPSRSRASIAPSLDGADLAVARQQGEACACPSLLKVGKPDAAIGFGAYVEVPLLGWCKGAGVPYLLHEQNSVPGLANR